ncbi:MAG: peptide ABC transporter substrate-binding protein [Oscillospiraceae bacterium]|nr:peptide ABC transporter substrate-binding protein [Oscillospiraceae bacterium]
MKKILAICLVLMLSLTFFAGCTPKAETSASKDLVVNIASEPPEMNSITMTDTVSFSVLRHIIENLTMLDANDEVVPGVATDWTVSEDGLTYTFNLRQGMKWSNGEEVTANDFVFAWTKLLDPATASEYSYMGYVFANGQAFNEGKATIDQVGFKATDDYTLEVTLESPKGYFLSLMSFGVFAPVNQKAYEEIGEAYGTDADKIVTNGAYTFTSWEHESKIVLTKNPDFYNVEKIGPDTITMLMITDASASYNSLVAGECDLVGLGTGEIVELAKAAGYEIHSYDDGSCFYFEYNFADAMMSNVNLRKAFSYAIDRETMCKVVYANNNQPASSLTPPGILGANGSKFQASLGVVEPFEYNPEKAKEYYAKACEELGTTDITIALICDEGDTTAKLAAFLQEQLKSILGAELTIEPMPFKSRLERMTNKDFSVVLAGWGPDYNDPMTFLDLWVTGGGNNHTSCSIAEYDALYAEAQKCTDVDRYFEIMTRLEQIIGEECIIAPLYWRIRDYAYSDKIAGGVIRTAFQDMNYKYVEFN